MRRAAWNTCKSCSAHSPSRCSDSLARNADAGWMRSPRRASSSVTGCWASQSTFRSGCSLRSSSATARSRRACPSPIGDDRYSTRRRRSSGLVHRRGGAVPGRNRLVKSRIAWLTITGSRACGQCPAPSATSSSAPVSSAIRSPQDSGRQRSLSPWIASTGQRTRRSNCSVSSVDDDVGGASSCVRIVSGLVSIAQRTLSSRCLVECGSLNSSLKKNSAYPRQSRSQ